MKPSFLKYEKPLLTCMLQADTPDRIQELFQKASSNGAEAYGLQFCRLKPEFRTKDIYRSLFSLADAAPTYVTNYRIGENVNKTDDALAAELLEFAACGAALCDIMGDYYDPQPGELSMDSIAISKQQNLIEQVHRAGASVLMSSHVGKPLSAEQVLTIALEHQRRGADISKIVLPANTMEEQLEHLRITHLLKQTLRIPFLFLSGGSFCYLQRRVGAYLGNCMTLCVYEYDDFATKLQPLLSDMKTLRELL